MAIILANDGLDASALAQFEKRGYTVDTQHYVGEDLLKRLAEVDVLIVRSATKVRVPEIDAAKKGGKLQLIIRGGVGVDNIDCEYAESCGISVRNTPAASSDAVAELALGHMLSLARYIYDANVTMRQGNWLKKNYEGTEIAGKVLGLIGFGRIAQSFACKALALGMRVVYNDVLGPNASVCEATYVELEELLAISDYISLHVPYDGGKPVIGREEIAQMKPGVYLINTSRGGVIDEDAMMDAIDSGQVAGAAIDVYAEEPTHNERILASRRVSMTPHIGAATVEAQARIGNEIVRIVNDHFA